MSNKSILLEWNKVYDYSSFNLFYLILKYSPTVDYGIYLEKRIPICLFFTDHYYKKDLLQIKNLIYNYRSKKIPIILDGLALCVYIDLFGLYFNLIVNAPMPKLNNLFFKYRKFNFLLNSKCDLCKVKNKCFGLSNIKKKDRENLFYIKRADLIAKSVKGDFKLVVNKDFYLDFLKHFLTCDGDYTLREFHFVSAFSKTKIDSFNSRLVYYANFLEEKLFGCEFEFLNRKVENKAFLNIIFNQFKQFRLNVLGYSYDVKNKLSRESFYLFFINENFLLLFLKQYFLIKTKFDFEFFKFLGFDFRDNLLYEIKIYSGFTDKFNVDLYVKLFNFNFKKIEKYCRPYLLVRRFSKSGEFRGMKLEFLFKKGQNQKEFVEYLKKEFGFDCKNMKSRVLDVVAFDLGLDKKLRKIAFYFK